MKHERTKTIVDEIRYWKQNHLLPDEYCNFLLALYTQGEGQVNEESAKGAQSPAFYMFMAMNAFLLPLSFLVIYFTEMGIIMQTVVLSSFVIGVWIHIRWLQYIKSDWLFIPLLNGALILLLLTVYLNQNMIGLGLSFYITLTLNFTLWIYLGWLWKLKTLFYSGVIGFIFLIIYIVS
ncbi:hypothetical protein DXT76_04800 [Halobacillus trueperi]|uniref:Uncharacterized protein n=1 Tax=Halobacillus trueperi TaxID=156205 RepID=A0A3D8VS06_9BACI|nr:hypothetical protein [Halobacillus trueperi]RDY72015.1 hypothetical protein DXT76_04800 [Halobacillus trueperi]